MRPFEPTWWLPGAHLPTVWGKKVRRQPPAHDRIERLTTPDGDHLTLARMGHAAAGKRHLLVLHGLEGDIRAKYAHGLLALARDRGWSGDLMLFRSCDGEINLTRRLYHSGETSDIDFVTRHLTTSTPGIELVVCGVSLGGNALVKWLGELGDGAASRVRRAAAVSVPFDLALGARFLERGFSRWYTRHFLKTLLPKAMKKLEQFPGAFDGSRAKLARTFWEFDNAVTAPLHGFRDAADYYERSSSMNFIERIRVPLLLFSALDDPFVPPAVMARAGSIASANQAIRCEFTERGGHVGWIEGALWPNKYFMERSVVDYLSV